MTMKLTRREMMTTAAALPLAGMAVPALADGHTTMQMPTHRDFLMGDFRVTTLLVGNRSVDNPQEIFGSNVDAETFAEVSAAARIPTDSAQFFFTPTVVNTGAEVILFDTGLNAAGTLGSLAAAGYAAEDITQVVLTHMHGDHIGGLMNDGAPTFGNAAYTTGQVEFDHWAAAENENFNNNVAPLAEQMTFVGHEDAIASGITAHAAFGHTPGHMGYRLESGGQQIILMADAANHYIYSVGHPDWEVRFDMDKSAAAQTRRDLLGLAAADGVGLVGYHMPFPGLGFVEAQGDGFRWVPTSYQFMG